MRKRCAAVFAFAGKRDVSGKCLLHFHSRFSIAAVQFAKRSDLKHLSSVTGSDNDDDDDDTARNNSCCIEITRRFTV
uniref:Uncharacterized protein n=1 Tax=Anopheles dirus TaxID=7168 RepID=A0A182N7C1_9DIPT